MYRNTRKQNGRFGGKQIDWNKLGDNLLFIVIGSWISFTILDMALKAHGL